MPASSASVPELLAFLKRVPLFAGLKDDALAILARVCRLVPVPQGGIIFSKEDPGSTAYVVRSGSVAIVLATPDGRELVINEMRAGECFGELALLTGQPRSANAVARQASQLILIPRDEFMSVLSREPAVTWHLLQTLSERLHASVEREGALAFLDAPARLARILLQLDREHSERGYLTMSQEEIAQRTGVARQTAAKVLGKWRRAGWIITGRGRIVVLNRAALRRHLGEPQPESL